MPYHGLPHLKLQYLHVAAAAAGYSLAVKVPADVNDAAAVAGGPRTVAAGLADEDAGVAAAGDDGVAADDGVVVVVAAVVVVDDDDFAGSFGGAEFGCDDRYALGCWNDELELDCSESDCSIVSASW